MRQILMPAERSIMIMRVRARGESVQLSCVSHASLKRALKFGLSGIACPSSRMLLKMFTQNMLKKMFELTHQRV